MAPGERATASLEYITCTFNFFDGPGRLIQTGLGLVGMTLK